MEDNNMNIIELIKFSVEEFSRLQTYMKSVEKIQVLMILWK